MYTSACATFLSKDGTCDSDFAKEYNLQKAVAHTAIWVSEGYPDFVMGLRAAHLVRHDIKAYRAAKEALCTLEEVFNSSKAE